MIVKIENRKERKVPFLAKGKNSGTLYIVTSFVTNKKGFVQCRCVSLNFIDDPISTELLDNLIPLESGTQVVLTQE